VVELLLLLLLLFMTGVLITGLPLLVLLMLRGATGGLLPVALDGLADGADAAATRGVRIGDAISPSSSPISPSSSLL